MTHLMTALVALGLSGEIALAGRLVALQGARCLLYVAEVDAGSTYLIWCDHPQERGVEAYDDPITAIEAGLRRAARPGAGHQGGRAAPS